MFYTLHMYSEKNYILANVANEECEISIEIHFRRSATEVDCLAK